MDARDQQQPREPPDASRPQSVHDKLPVAADESGSRESGAETCDNNATSSLQMNSKPVPKSNWSPLARSKQTENPSSKSSATSKLPSSAEKQSQSNIDQTGSHIEHHHQSSPGCAINLPDKVSTTNGPMLAKEKKKKKSRVLDPSGSLCYHWSMVVSFAFLYNFWSLSYRFAFREIDFDTVAFWFALDYSADLIYLLDVVINFHTGYLEDGVLQRNIDKIGQHYRECTLFYLDCFCLLPLDVLYLSIGFNSILRCTRLVKIYKFWSYADRTERHTNYPNVFRTFTLVHYILVIFHWNACLFHMISKNNKFIPQTRLSSEILDIENLYKINDNRCEDILCQYLHAFYWSTLTLTTIGDLPKPRTKGEYFYVTIELFFGLFLFASVLGHVANIVTNVSAARKEFQAKLDAVKIFMRMRHVSDDLQNKVIRWFDYLWVSQKSSDEERSVACLPDRLKAEIAIHVHLDTLKRVDIFQNTEAGFLCELVLRLKPVLFSPGDYVCRKNEVGHEMYIVSKGILEVVTDGGKTVVATLKAGSYFGEISVLNVGLAGNKRTASVRSVGYSDLFCLNKQDLWDVLKNYPNAEARIRTRAEERLSKLDINNKQQQQQRQRQHPAALGPKALYLSKGKRKRNEPATWTQCQGCSRSDAIDCRPWPTCEPHRRRICSSGSRYNRDSWSSQMMTRRNHHINQVVPENYCYQQPTSAAVVEPASSFPPNELRSRLDRVANMQHTTIDLGDDEDDIMADYGRGQVSGAHFSGGPPMGFRLPVADHQPEVPLPTQPQRRGELSRAEGAEGGSMGVSNGANASGQVPTTIESGAGGGFAATDADDNVQEPRADFSIKERDRTRPADHYQQTTNQMDRSPDNEPTSDEDDDENKLNGGGRWRRSPEAATSGCKRSSSLECMGPIPSEAAAVTSRLYGGGQVGADCLPPAGAQNRLSSSSISGSNCPSGIAANCVGQRRRWPEATRMDHGHCGYGGRQQPGSGEADHRDHLADYDGCIVHPTVCSARQLQRDLSRHRRRQEVHHGTCDCAHLSDASRSPPPSQRRRRRHQHRAQEGWQPPELATTAQLLQTGPGPAALWVQASGGQLANIPGYIQVPLLAPSGALLAHASSKSPAQSISAYQMLQPIQVSQTNMAPARLEAQSDGETESRLARANPIGAQKDMKGSNEEQKEKVASELSPGKVSGAGSHQAAGGCPNSLPPDSLAGCAGSERPQR